MLGDNNHKRKDSHVSQQIDLQASTSIPWNEPRRRFMFMTLNQSRVAEQQRSFVSCAPIQEINIKCQAPCTYVSFYAVQPKVSNTELFYIPYLFAKIHYEFRSEDQSQLSFVYRLFYLVFFFMAESLGSRQQKAINSYMLQQTLKAIFEDRNSCAIYCFGHKMQACKNGLVRTC